MFEENINISGVSDSIKGHVTVELFDGATGALIEKQEKHNFIANQGKEYFQYLQRINFKDQISALAGAGYDTDYGAQNVFNRLVLTDSTKPEDSTNEWHMTGNLVGYSEKTVYSGPDVLRGSPNISLCESTATYTQWVFDWPTHAAIGTIGSIGWHHTAVKGAYESINENIFITTTLTSNTPVGISPGYITRRPDGSILVGSGTTITNCDTNYVSAGSFGSVSVRGIAWDDANSQVWVISNNQLVAYDMSGNVVVGPVAITSRSYVGLCYDGTDFWTFASGSVYRISTAGADLASFPIDMSVSPDAGANHPSSPVVHDLVLSPTNNKLYVIFRLTGASFYQNNNFISAKVYDTSGNKVDMWVSFVPFYNNARRTSPTNNYVVGTAYFDIVDENNLLLLGNLGSTYPGGNNASIMRLDGMGSRVRLASPITKDDTQTLRITYRVDYP